MSKKNAVEKAIDPTLPFEEVELDGQVLKVCMNFRALALAERKFCAQGHYDAILLQALPQPFIFLNLQFLFACSLYHFHPEIPYEQAMAMVTPENAAEVYDVVNRIIKRSLVRGGSEDPPAPAQ